MNIKQAIEHVVNGRNLSCEQMRSIMQQVMGGQVSEGQIAGLLVALRMKGEHLDELTGAAQIMRELVTPVPVVAPYLVDTCGTGGDGASLINVSTATAFVAAAAGASVAKHGNRSVSSSTGSADLLEAAGVKLSLSPEQVGRAIESVGVGFMFAPAHHGAMKHASKPRKDLGCHTIFNVLGPMTNPAGVKRQVIGVFAKRLCKPVAQVLARLGSEHVMVVHSEDGLDELSIAAKNHVVEWRDGRLDQYSLDPAEFDLMAANLDGLVVTGADDSLRIIMAAFSNENTPEAQKAAAIIALNGGAAIYVSGVAGSLQEGVKLAEDMIASGAAKQKLAELREFSHCL